MMLYCNSFDQSLAVFLIKGPIKAAVCSATGNCFQSAVYQLDVSKKYCITLYVPQYRYCASFRNSTSNIPAIRVPSIRENSAIYFHSGKCRWSKSITLKLLKTSLWSIKKFCSDKICNTDCRWKPKACMWL